MENIGSIKCLPLVKGNLFIDKVEANLKLKINKDSEVNPIFNELPLELKEEDFDLFKKRVEYDYNKYSLETKYESKEDYINEQILSLIAFVIETLVGNFSKRFIYKNKSIEVNMLQIGDSLTFCKEDINNGLKAQTTITPKPYSIGITFNPTDIYNGDIEQFQNLIMKIFKSFALAIYKLIDDLDSDKVILAIEKFCHIKRPDGNKNNFEIFMSFDCLSYNDTKGE